MVFAWKTAPATFAPAPTCSKGMDDRDGLTTQEACNLRPGAYVFEGKRPGYRSRLVEVTVQAGGGVPVEVRIVCDERS